MRYSKIYLITVIVLGLISFSCSDLQNDISTPSKLALHGTNVFNQTSQDFHGVTVKNTGLQSCKQCHDANFDGGTAKVSCATANCHPNIAVHQDGINVPTSSNFHGLYIATNKVKMNDCNQCHGNNFSGGSASPACTQCHTTITVHQSGITDPASTNFHGRYVATLKWDMSQCKTCHGNDYAGGVASPSCNTCHTNTGGPEACNTCHGNFNNPSLIAPPVDLSRSTDTKSPGVGAHSTHLLNVKIGQLVKCNECHTRDNSRLADLKDFYMPARDFSPVIEYAGSGILVLSLLGVFITLTAVAFVNRHNPVAGVVLIEYVGLSALSYYFRVDRFAGLSPFMDKFPLCGCGKGNPAVFLKLLHAIEWKTSTVF